MNSIQEVVNNFVHFSGTALLSRSQKISFPQLHEMVQSRGRKLLKLGLYPTDRVLLFADNSPEWLIWSLAINWAGMVDVPRGEYTTPEEINFIVRHSGANAAIVQSEKYLKMLSDDSLEQLDYIIGIEPIESTINIDELAESDRLPAPVPGKAINSVIYTSGTTDKLKGVKLTNENYLSNVKALVNRIDLTQSDTLLSVLPAWHVYERIMKYAASFKGATTFYSSPREMIKDIRFAKPTVLGTVPRLWELVYTKIQHSLAGNGLGNKIKNTLFSRALDYKLKGITTHRFSAYLAELVIFPKIRKLFGPNFRYAISGGGDLPHHIENLFTAVGIQVLSGYGLTETSPVIAVNSPTMHKKYTVGKPLENLHVKIIDPTNGNECSTGKTGLIYVKGPSVSPGYYHDYVDTSKALHDRFFDTGDLGFIDSEGFLTIVGRYKNLIVLSSGENVQPLKLENKLTESQYIAAAIVIGDKRKSLGALLVPDFETLFEFCKHSQLCKTSQELPQLFDNPIVLDLYDQEIKRLINTDENIKMFERIKAFELLPEPFTPGRELTATMKPKRHVIEKIYSSYYEKLNKKI